MTFDEALTALRPILGEPRHVRRANAADPECCGYSSAYWHPAGDMYATGYLSLTDEDAMPMLYAGAVAGGLPSASWIVDPSWPKADPVAEGSTITDAATAARAALAYHGWAP